MGRWRRRPVWGSLVALVLVVPVLTTGCSIRALPEPPSTTASSVAAPTTTVGTIGGTTVATRAFLLDWDAPGSPVRPPSHTGSELVNLVLVFPLLRSPPRCVRKVELRLWVLRLDHPRPRSPPTRRCWSRRSRTGPRPGSRTRRWSTTGRGAPGP